MTTPDLPADPRPDSDPSPGDTSLRERLLSNVIASLLPETKALREFRENRANSRLALLHLDNTGRAGTIQFDDESDIPFELRVVHGETTITANWPDGVRPLSLTKCLVPERSTTGPYRITVPARPRPLSAHDRDVADRRLPDRVGAAPMMGGAMRAEAVRDGGFGPVPTFSNDGTLAIPVCPDVGAAEVDEAVFVVEATVGRRTTTAPFVAERAPNASGLSGALRGFRDKLSDYATEAEITVRTLKPADWLELPKGLAEVALETAQLDVRSLMETEDPRSFAFVSDPAPFFKSDDTTEQMWLVRYLPKAAAVEGAIL